MRLIDADAFKEVLYGLMPKFDEENDKTCIEGQTIYTCIQYLEEQPEVAWGPTQDSNEPLTLEELQELDGKPVWVVWLNGYLSQSHWTLVDAGYKGCRNAYGGLLKFSRYGVDWVAYRYSFGEV